MATDHNFLGAHRPERWPVTLQARRVSVPVAVRCIGGPPGTLLFASAPDLADAAYLRPRAKPRPYPPRTATAHAYYDP